jgi:hypothetical protein
MNTASILTMAKHEHDFINPWIEYHINLGFSHFYILVDNVLEKQPEYIIEENLKQYVSLIYIDENDVVEFLGNNSREIIKGGHHFSYIQHNLLNHKIIYANIINEDWVTAIGIDQYMYLNGNTIQYYLKYINDTCTQIIFPWSFCCFNNNDSNFDNFLENIQLYKNYYSGTRGHSNGMIRTKNLLYIRGDSHSFVSNTSTQQIFISDEYYEMPNYLDTWSVFKIVDEKLSSTLFNELNISSFHIMLRNVNEYFIKNLFYWDNTNNELLENSFVQLVSDIRNKTKDILQILNKNRNLDTLNQNCNDFLKYSIELKFPKIESKNNTDHYNNLILNELYKYNITKEEFESWKRTLFNKE